VPITGEEEEKGSLGRRGRGREMKVRNKGKRKKRGVIEKGREGKGGWQSKCQTWADVRNVIGSFCTWKKVQRCLKECVKWLNHGPLSVP
jgi:hypothetical protein